MPSGADRKRWLELNQIICDICEPRISKRKISTAADLADALRRLQRGKRRRQSGLAVWMTTLMLAGFVGWAGWEMVKDSDLGEGFEAASIPDPRPSRWARVKIISMPENAEVLDASGRSHGNHHAGNYHACRWGTRWFFRMQKPGYRTKAIREKVPPSAVNEPFVVGGALQVYSPPQTGEPWKDHLGNLYQPVGGEHVGSGLRDQGGLGAVRRAATRPGRRIPRSSEDGQPVEVALSSPAEAAAYCEWFRAGRGEDRLSNRGSRGDPLVGDRPSRGRHSASGPARRA